MNFGQIYETLFLRDIAFYLLPGGTGLLGISSIIWTQFPDSLKNKIETVIPNEKLFQIVIFLSLSYILGHIFYIIHNFTVGRLPVLDRCKIIRKFLGLDQNNSNLPHFIHELFKTFIESITNNESIDIDKKEISSIENILQLYFISDKYIRLKKPDFYIIYISRLTATSRFNGVMSVVWMILAWLCFSFFFTEILQFSTTVIIIFIFCIFSFCQIKQSISDQEELVWNILQAIYLLQIEDKKNASSIPDKFYRISATIQK